MYCKSIAKVLQMYCKNDKTCEVLTNTKLRNNEELRKYIDRNKKSGFLRKSLCEPGGVNDVLYKYQ